MTYLDPLNVILISHSFFNSLLSAFPPCHSIKIVLVNNLFYYVTVIVLFHTLYNSLLKMYNSILCLCFLLVSIILMTTPFLNDPFVCTLLSAYSKKIVLLIYKLYAIIFTHLKCIIQWLLMHLQSCVSIIIT